MTLHSDFMRISLDGVCVTSTPEGLFAIQDEDCPAVVWQRQPLACFQTWLDALPSDNLPSARIVLRPYATHEAVSDLVDLAGLPDSAERAMLVGDIAALADIFARVMRAEYLRLRLDVITRQTRRNLYVDRNAARLVCTYRGPQEHYRIASNDETHCDMFEVPTGSPTITRRTLWPKSKASADLDRHSLSNGSGETRLILILDPSAAPDSDVCQPRYKFN